MKRRALVVGAGAVGQPYGRHLQRGGTEVAFLVKPRHAEELRGGATLYPLNRLVHRTTPVRWDDYQLMTSAEEVGRSRWDQVYLTISSTALHGPWLPELVRHLGDATVIVLQPGLEDRQVVERHVPAERIVQGLISLVSYPAPLPGETRFPEPGIAYWFPPLSPSPFSGPTSRVDDVVEALDAGDFPATKHPDVSTLAGFPNALMMPYLVALEAAGWTFDGLRAGEHLGRASQASREAMAVVERKHGNRRPAAMALAARPFVIRAGLALGRRVVPFDLETYFRVHFTKVGDQTRAMMTRYLELARDEGLPSQALEELCTSLAPLEHRRLAR